MVTYFEKLKALQNNAYAPYSRYFVAAVLVLDDGSEFSGVNVENASFGGTICAERSAFVSCISQHSHQFGYKELHLLAGDTKRHTMPCGICRQFMSEFVSEDFSIYVYNHAGEVKTVTMEEILPFSFSKDALVSSS